MNPPAPRSGRRWLRPRNIALAVGGVAVVWIAREAWWIITAEPAPIVDYADRMQTLCESNQPPGADGWPLLLAASTRTMEIKDVILELYPDDGTVRQVDILYPLDFDRVLEGPLVLDELERELRAIELMRERGVMDELAEASACPRAVRPLRGTPPLIVNVQLPELAQFRMLMKARLASMRIAAEAGDDAERLAAFEQVLAIGRARAAQAFLIDRLVGISIMQGALFELSHEVADRPLDEATARALLDAMDRQVRIPPMTQPFESEHLSALDMIQYLFSDDGHGDGRIDLGRFNRIQGAWGNQAPGGGTVIGRVGAVFLPGRAETTALCDEYYEGVIGNARLDPVTRAASGFDDNAFIQGLSPCHIFLKMMLPAIAAATRQHDQLETHIASTRIMLGVEIFRVLRGRLPVDLAELGADVFPGDADALKDPTHGGSFLYRIVEDGDAGWPYLLYSTGVDQVDDITAAGEDYEDAISPGARLEAAGTDVLFLRTRPERSR